MREAGVNCNWSPVPNDYFPGFPGTVGFAPGSADKPIIYGSTLGEFANVPLDTDEKMAMTEEEKLRFLRERFGSQADHLIDLFRKAYPTHDILDLAYMDSMVRIPTAATALELSLIHI